MPHDSTSAHHGVLEPVTEGGSESESDDPHSSSRRDKDAPAPPTYPFAGATGAPHYPARLQKSASSLATNLASARGIPLVRPAAGSTTSTSRRRRPSAPSASDLPTSSKPTTSPLNLIPPDQPQSLASQDASFTRFYSSLNSLITKIGSPFTASLAFTGLPVGPDAKDTEAVPIDVLPKGYTQGRGRGRNLGQNDTAGGESFYVVPYSGGTMSYAGVVQRDSPDDDQDAETRSVRRSRTYPSPGAGANSPTHRGLEREKDELARFAGHDKTLEELQLENSTLRRTLEQLSRNMSKWQKKTRESEMELKSSIMALSRTGGGQAGINDILSQAQRRSWLHIPNNEEDDDNDVCAEGRRFGEMELIKEERETIKEMGDRVKVLEDELRDRAIEMERMSRENEKLRKTVTRFKEKWDALREGAKKRERNKIGRAHV